jgi:membrane protease YdiL (CAAX protease family)
MQVYAALGDPASDYRHAIGGVVFLVAALEELVWRGLVMRVLTERLGWLRSWFLQAGLFGLAHVPTMFLLGSQVAGPNPLLVAAGIAYSLVWGRIAMRMDRLPPALFAHAFFTWGVFEFPIWRP